MQLSETVKVYPTEYQKILITQTMTEYINAVNGLVSDAVSGHSIAKTTTADIIADLPSALVNQCIRDAKSVVRKHYKYCHKAVLKNRSLAKRGSDIRVKAPRLPVLKKPCFYVNNQNYKIKDNRLEFPVMINGRSKRISVMVRLTDRQKSLFSDAKFGTMRVVIKNHTLIDQIIYEAAEPGLKSDGNIMGIDLGIKCPAAGYCSDGSVRFYGNGRKNKYMRRHYAYLRKKLQTSKKIKAVKRIDDKEQRIMRDTDHKLSHDIVETAVAHNVNVMMPGSKLAF